MNRILRDHQFKQRLLDNVSDQTEILGQITYNAIFKGMK